MSNEFWTEVEALLKPVVTTTIEYRLHYDDDGNIIACSMVDHPDSTQYIVVTKSEYDRYFDYRVIKGHLKKIYNDAVYHRRLKPSTQGFKVLKGHAGILIEDEQCKDTEYYDRNN